MTQKEARSLAGRVLAGIRWSKATAEEKAEAGRVMTEARMAKRRGTKRARRAKR
jgi:hypothetical protein